MYSGFSNYNKVAGGNRKLGGAHLGRNKGSHLGKIPEVGYPLLCEGDYVIPVTYM